MKEIDNMVNKIKALNHNDIIDNINKNFIMFVLNEIYDRALNGYQSYVLDDKTYVPYNSTKDPTSIKGTTFKKIRKGRCEIKINLNVFHSIMKDKGFELIEDCFDDDYMITILWNSKYLK